MRLAVGLAIAVFPALATGQQPDTARPQPVAPASVTARAPTTEFERRMLEGKGQFITREELERSRASRLADLVARFRGVRVFRASGGAAYAMSSRGQVTLRANNVRCYVHVYLDDAPVFSGDIGQRSTVTGEDLFNLNNVAPGDLEGVEFYSGLGQIPPKYNRTGSVCGVLLLWTKAR